MTVASDDLLGARLALVEQRGRDELSRRRRARALDRGAALAMRVLPVAAVVALAVRRLAPVSAGVAVAVAVAAALAVTLVAGGIAAARQAARGASGRMQALALVDGRLDLADRAVTTAEFLAVPRRDGFREAALIEAAPWMEQALHRPIAADGVADGTWRRSLPFAIAGLAMLLAVALLRPAADGAAAMAPDRIAVRSIAGAGAVSDPGVSREAAPSNWMQRLARTLGLGGDAASGGTRGAGQGGAGTAAGDGSGGAGAGKAGPAGAQGAGSSDGRSGKGGGEGAGMAGSTGMGIAGTGADAAGSPQAASAPAAAAAPREAPRSPPATPAGAPPASGWPGAALPAAAGGASGTPRQGSGASNARRSTTQRGEGPSSGTQQGEGQGSGAGTGSDAIKRSRGLAALLLAVPAEDKLVGTPNRGPAQSRLRGVTPTAGDTQARLAEARGMQGGALGSATHRPLPPQDARLIARYFDRTAGAAR